MRVEDLHHDKLLELDPHGGMIRFGGQRALLLDAVAMGLLRKYLVENFGLIAARTVLTQFGFAHGWRMAEAIKEEIDWDTEDDWRRAGARLHMLEGLFQLPEVGSADPLSKTGAVLLASYEAEQHLLHFGRSDNDDNVNALPTTCCWTICGLTSGYISRSTGKEIYVFEDRCIGKGDAACHLFGRTREQWGDERADELRFFTKTHLKEALDVSLSRVTETLKAAEKKLRAHRRALIRVAPDVEQPLDNVSVTKSAAMGRVVDLARRVAKVDSSVLITGESGSGKERIARMVHDESTRAAGPFVAVNCGAITDTLLESELFGHARGAFTGASHDRPGLFEAANGGTLLLDEVGDVSPSMQVKLLRALQEREIRRVGENRVRRVDVRIVAATNRDLEQGVKDGTFREDLFYRLKVVELRVPPLRERRDDILPLSRLLLATSALRMKRKVLGFAPETADQLLRYRWPGNVRELENAMERAVALARGTRVELVDLPEEVRRSVVTVEANGNGNGNGTTLNQPSAPVRPLAEVEKEYILLALALNGGNQTLTATQLRIGSATLYRKLKLYGALSGGGGHVQ